MKKKDIILWSAFISIFIAGIAIGAGSVYLISQKNKPVKTSNKKLPIPMMNKRILDRLSKDLNLNDKQKENADKSIRKMITEIEKIHSTQKPKIETIITTTFSEIEATLDENQKKKFKAICLKNPRLQTCGRNSQHFKGNGPGRKEGNSFKKEHFGRHRR